MCKGDVVLEGKAGYLNTGSFMVRNLVAVLIWIFFAKKLVGNSIAQDTTKDRWADFEESALCRRSF